MNFFIIAAVQEIIEQKLLKTFIIDNEVRGLSLPLILIVVLSIVSIFALAVFLVAKQNNFSIKQIVDPRPEQTYQKAEDKL